MYLSRRCGIYGEKVEINIICFYAHNAFVFGRFVNRPYDGFYCFP